MTSKNSGVPVRPLAAANGGRGKELPRDEVGTPIPKQPRNRKERRAKAAWERKHKRMQAAPPPTTTNDLNGDPS